MNSLRKRRLYFIGLLGSCIFLVTFLVLQALRENINLFFSPDEILQGEARKNTRIRVGGIVKSGSVKKRDNLAVEFVLSDFQKPGSVLTVQYKGILPDLFKEGQGIVTLGRLGPDNIFMADEVLAKHDENYMPPEIK